MNKMTKKEAISYWEQRSEHIHNWLKENEDVEFIGEYVEAIDLAIEALQTIDNCDQCEWCCPSDGTPTIHVVRCEDCKWELICRQTVEQANTDDIEHRPLKWCSYGERREKCD